MLLVRKVCFFDANRALRLVLDTEVVFVHHPDRQIDGLLLEVYDQAVAVEVALIVLVHLDALVAVSALVDDAVFLELVLDLLLVGVAGEVADVDCAVFLHFWLLVGLVACEKELVVEFSKVTYVRCLHILALFASRVSLHIHWGLGGDNLSLSQRVVNDFVGHSCCNTRQSQANS
jgi:hypothetical protein